MEIRLNWLHLSNFKGIKDFKLIANGRNASVFGNNATGKTSVIDSFMWLLFDKDSNNNADTNFTIKPQDENGNDIKHLQTEVEAELLIDGKPLRLKKLRKEKWVTRRGTAEQVMDGHTKKYWFNEVPCKAKEYQAKVDELVNENVFKMITDPTFFNTKIKWEDRRKILLEISGGNLTNEQVIASDENLSNLTEILSGRTVDEYKLVLADKLKNLKKERDDLPPRIDELTRSLPQLEPYYTGIEEELKGHKETLQGIELLLTNSTKKADEINKKYQELAKINSQLEEIKLRIKAESGADKKKLLDEKTDLEGGKLLLQSGINNLQMQIDQAQRTLKNNTAKREMLIKEWKSLNSTRVEISSEQFEIGELATDCPMCGQEIPKEKIDSQIEELKANFEKDRKERLGMNQILIEQNVGEGKAVKENTDKISKDLLELQTELNQKLNQINQIALQLTALDKEIAKPTAEPDYTKNQEHNELLQKMQQLKAELDKPVEDKSAELIQRKSDVQAKIDECNKVLNGKEELEKKKARIEELKADEKRVSALIAKLEGHKFLLDQFVVAKVNLLEDSINSQFKHVRFKLFEENITNEGIKETCIALVNTNGAYVKYEDGNSAGQINAGLDIINSLCRFYGVTAPIFIDNRESVSEIMEINSQIINLVKPPTWDELDKEVQRALAGVEEKEEYSEEDITKFEKAKKAWNDRNKSLRVEVEE